MTRRKRLQPPPAAPLGAACLAALLCLAAWAPSAPAAEPEPAPGPGELAREGAESLLRALEALIMMIPQYEAPELTEDGDIIIRRKRPEEGGPDGDGPDGDGPDGDGPHGDGPHEGAPDDRDLGGPEVEETET